MAIGKIGILGVILCFIVLWGVLIWKWSQIYTNKKSTTFDKVFQTLFMIVTAAAFLAVNIAIGDDIAKNIQKNTMVAVTGGLPAVNNAANQVAAAAKAGNNAAAKQVAAAANQVAAAANASGS